MATKKRKSTVHSKTVKAMRRKGVGKKAATKMARRAAGRC